MVDGGGSEYSDIAHRKLLPYLHYRGVRDIWLMVNTHPDMKAMLPPRQREGIKEFYFTTNTSSMRVSQYLENPKASIYFCDRRYFRGVMLLGTMEVLETQEVKEMIWREGDTMYYPLGVTDPDYCVLHFTAQAGRYYSNFKSENFVVK